MSGASVNVRIDFRGVQKKLSPAALKRGQYAMANQMLPDMNLFVPADQYDLRLTGHVTAGGKQIVWRSPYAKAQFYGGNGKAVFRNYTTPGTGKRWDLKATPIFVKDWVKVFAKGAGL